MGNVQRGEISTFESPYDSDGNATRARILVKQRGDILTRPLIIPRGLRGNSLIKGTKVIFVEFSDHSGAILMREDGETE